MSAGKIKKTTSELVKHSRFIIIFLIFYLNISIFTITISYAQNSNIRFERISYKQGLELSSISCILQDKEGFIWLGSHNGLCRYDGYNFKIFRNNPKDSLSLSYDYISSICEDSFGNLWIGTLGGGLNKYSSQTETFTRYTHDPKDKKSLPSNSIENLYPGKLGVVWIGTWGDGLYKMSVENETTERDGKEQYKFTKYKNTNFNSKLSQSNLISHTIVSSKDELWVSSGSGLAKINIETREVKEYAYDANNQTSISSNNISCICEDKSGNIWAGTWDKGLNLYDPKTDGFIRFPYSGNKKNSTNSNRIFSLSADSDGSLWIGTFGGGLNHLLIPNEIGPRQIDYTNYHKVQIFKYSNNIYDQYSISGNYIFAIFEDKSGVIWVGIDNQGLNKFDKKKLQFTHYYSKPGDKNSLNDNLVLNFLLDKRDRLWIATANGLNILDRKTGEYSLYLNEPSNPHSISDNNVRNIIKDKKGRIWIGTFNGLNRYDGKKNRFVRYHNPSKNLDPIPIFSLMEDHTGLIWYGTYGKGLFCFDPESEKLINYTNDPKNSSSISDNIIWAIEEDQSGTLWVGTALGGLCGFNRETGKFKNYRFDASDTSSINDNKILSLYVDKKNTLWIGTVKGLNKLVRDFKSERFTFKHYTKGDGLSGESVNAIAEDNNGYLWVSSNTGITRINDLTGEFKRYDFTNGLQEKEFAANSVYFDEKTLEMFFGGVGGFNIFQPDKLKEDSLAPVTKLVKLSILNKTVEIGERINGRVLLENSISNIKTLTLTHKEYVFGIEFAALHYNSPSGNQFAFKLKGFDPDAAGWNYVGEKRTATYTNLDPGEYVFMVKACNNDGVWSEEATELKIIVLAPWWETNIFRVSIVVFFLLLIFIAYRLRLSMLKKQKKELEIKVAKRTEELSSVNTLMEEKQEEISKQNEELISMNSMMEEKHQELSSMNILLKEKQEEISIQNEELMKHRQKLESLVHERTSELIVAKDKAEESDRLKSSFLANMSHEIRTPMNAIVGFSSLLDNKSLDEEKRKLFVKAINQNSSSLLALINDILDISVIEANQLTVNESAFCVDDILHELNSYYQLLNNKDIKLVLSIPEKNSNEALYSDHVRVRQILDNLLSNAFKYTEKGTIKFGYTIEPKNLLFFVSDTGIGIGAEEKKAIFNYFYKIESDINKLYRGTGIGLSICSKLVNLLNGDIWVESEKGKGSTFYFTMPKATGDLLTKELPKIEVDSTVSLKDMNILVAEDVENNYELIANILSEYEINLIWSRNGEEAVDYVSKELLDTHFLILMDIKMPVMNGIEACKVIKALKKNIPVIALTAYAQSGDREKLLADGFDDYISKPINPDVLIETIKRNYSIQI